MAYISFLFARFGPSNGHLSLGALLTAAFFGGLLGFALGAMFANRVRRKYSLSR
ncbi:MAG: hypothetical protein WB919_06710 [Candidatus Sulfotelmatobacter sp.]